jgi:hypothetical protein
MSNYLYTLLTPFITWVWNFIFRCGETVYEDIDCCYIQKKWGYLLASLSDQEQEKTVKIGHLVFGMYSDSKLYGIYWERVGFQQDEFIYKKWWIFETRYKIEGCLREFTLIISGLWLSVWRMDYWDNDKFIHIRNLCVGPYAFRWTNLNGLSFINYLVKEK